MMYLRNISEKLKLDCSWNQQVIVYCISPKLLYKRLADVFKTII